MKQYNTVEEFKQAIKEWLQSNPFQSSIVIDGKEMPFLFNFLVNYQIDGEDRQSNASSCHDMTCEDLFMYTDLQLDKLLENTKAHLTS